MLKLFLVLKILASLYYTFVISLPSIAIVDMCFPSAAPIPPIDYCCKSLKNLRGISFGCLNICSIKSKIDDVKTLLEHSDLDVLCLVETFLTEEVDDTLLEVPGYNFHRCDRNADSNKKSGGGLLMYYKNSRDISPIQNSDLITPSIECTFLTLNLKQARPTVIGAIYRPPDASYINSIDDWEKHMNSLNFPNNADLVLLGDINIDLLENNSASKCLNKFLKSNCLEQVINKPTRITDTSSTLIDHIYINNPSLYHHRGVIDPNLSDHCMTFITRKYQSPSKEKQTVFIRNYRNFDASLFEEDLEQVNWNSVTNCSDVNEAVSCFNFEFLTVLNKHLPWKKLRVRKSNASWVTSEFLSLIDRREYLAKKYRDCPCPEHHALKLQSRRDCVKMRNILKRDYLRKTLDQYRNNPKKLWQTIRNFWPTAGKTKNRINKILNYTDDSDIADALNDHFSSVASKVLDNIDHTTDIHEVLPPQQPPIFDFKEITYIAIASAIDRLSSSSASSHDGITAFMLKAGKAALVPIFHHIFNLSINTKVFPDIWKEAIVTPLFKSGQRDDPNNYRPISVLSTISKVLERCVHDQLYSYLSVNNLLNDRQSGFRKGHSTSTCLVDFLDNIYREVDEGGACGVLFLDLSKAFDTVDHEILLLKLRHLGLKTCAVSWFQSYLFNRQQVTRSGGRLSSPRRMSSGVPQGSILGPLLFICYINDLPNCLSSADSFLYADDTAILVKGKDVMDIELNLNEEFKRVDKWFSCNKLSVNTTKTKGMLFSSNRYRDKDKTLTIDEPRENTGQAIEHVSVYKYLGLWLDPHLTFEHHMNSICRKVKSRTYILRQMRSYISENLALDLYQSLIAPHFLYADTIYDGGNKAAKHNLQVAQNNALRVVKNVDQRYSATALHSQLNVDWLDISRQKRCCTETFKVLNNMTPTSMGKQFRVHEQLRCLRSNSDLNFVPVTNRTIFADNNFGNRCHKYWSTLTPEIHNIPTLNSFKTCMRNYSGFTHSP